MITLYFYENIIQYKEKEEINEFIISPKAMQYGKIRNIPLFEEKIGELIKKEKWNTLFHKKELTIILPIHYEEIDKEVLNTILNNYGFNKVKYIKEINLLELKKNQTIINLHEKYFTLIKNKDNNKKCYFYPINIFGTIEESLKYLKTNSTLKERFFFFGSNEKLPQIIDKILDSNVFYYSNYKTYLISKCIP